MVQLPAENSQPPSADRARLAAIVESSDDAIISKTLDGIIETWNGGAERIFGFTAAEAVGQPITIIVPADHLSEEAGILVQLRLGRRVDHLETVRQTKAGRQIHVSITSSPVRDETGTIVGVSKVVRDITPQKQFEQQLQLARDVAESASQAKNEFLSRLSHELRTPLTPVLAVVSLLEKESNVSPEVKDHVEIIRRNIEMEARLVDDLLDLTRIERGLIHLRCESLDAHTLIHQITAIFIPQITQKNLKLTISLDAAESHILADPARVQQMLINLLSNALKFTPAGGAISVITANESGMLKIEVTDTGIGIEPEMTTRLFRPFEQGEQNTSRSFGGLGLGLSIVKSLAELHHGTVSAFSEGKDTGTRLTISLPLQPSQIQIAAEPVKMVPAIRSARVLLVEDHEDTRRVMARVLTHGGCTVTTAASVKEAIDAAETQPFDLLVSDLGLPDGSGHQVMQHMAIKFKTPGIALSGFGQETDIIRSREAGFARHLTKPVSVQTLLNNIAEVTAPA